MSSKTLGDLSGYGRKYDVVRVNPPGTGGVQDLEDYSFSSVIESMESALLAFKRPVFLIGHSFGGLYAIALAARSRLDVRAWVGVGTPVSLATFAEMSTHLKVIETPEVRQAEAEFAIHPGAETFRRCFEAWSIFYFSAERMERGRRMLSEDQASYRCFMQVFPEVFSPGTKQDLLTSLGSLDCPKLLVARAKDLIAPSVLLKKDAENSHSRFSEIPGEGHFIGWDDPVALSEALLGFLENHDV